MLTGNACKRPEGKRITSPSLLTGLLHDADGNRLSPSHAVKSGRRYRYYISSFLISGDGLEEAEEGLRIPAHELEVLVTEAIKRFLRNRTRLFDFLCLDRRSLNATKKVFSKAIDLGDLLVSGSANDKETFIRSLVERVIVSESELHIDISIEALRKEVGLDFSNVDQKESFENRERFSLGVPAELRRCGGASKVIVSDDDWEIRGRPDPALLKLLGRAHRWFEKLAGSTVQSAAEIARDEGVTRSYVTRIIRLAFLAPDITEAIVLGSQPPALTAERLIRASNLPLHWSEQRELLGFAQKYAS